MIRHLIPRVATGRWGGIALTKSTVDLTGLAAAYRRAHGDAATQEQSDDVTGRWFMLQWLGIAVEINVGCVDFPAWVRPRT